MRRVPANVGRADREVGAEEQAADDLLCEEISEPPFELDGCSDPRRRRRITGNVERAGGVPVVSVSRDLRPGAEAQREREQTSDEPPRDPHARSNERRDGSSTPRKKVTGAEEVAVEVESLRRLRSEAPKKPEA